MISCSSLLSRICLAEKKGVDGFVCGSRLMEQPALLRLLTLYMFGRIPCSSIDNGCRRVVKDIKL